MSLIINIGSDPENDIVLPESYISAQHAQLLRDETGNWFINDLRSASGTYVNGERIATAVAIKETDTVFLGGSVLDIAVIFSKYTTAAPKKIKKSRFYHYWLGLAAAVILFVVFFLVNEFFFTKNNSSTPPGENGHASLNEDKKDNIPQKQIIYDLSCTTLSKDKSITSLTDKLDSLRNRFIENSGVTVSLQDEIEFGDQNHLELLKEGKVQNNADSRHLEEILAKLVSKMTAARGFTYKLFLTDSKDINSWTSGGRIYFTQGMLNFTKNDDEIAGIIGHEINHNELFHINAKLKAEKAAKEKFGKKNGNLVASINRILSTPFGKKDEVYCDLKGEDLVILAGYDPCKVIALWRRMSELEESYTAIGNFLRSHPYAVTRVTCIEHHLKTNYTINCTGQSN